MLRALPGWLVGSFMGLLLAVNTVFWAIPVYVATIFKLLSPTRGLRDLCSRGAARAAQTWASVNVLFVDTFLPTRWEIRGVEALDRGGKYLVCANHQTWNDIYTVMKAFDRRAPFFKFFLKQELIWVPVLGLAWWGLDYPFMKRYSPGYLAKHPEMRGKDFETTRRACERYRNVPVTVLNFLEGTRFTKAKHASQKSPYRHLLKPKAGGFALAVSAMGDNVQTLLDVTIVYPDGARGFWDFLAGRVRQVIVDVRSVEIPAELKLGNYEGDPAFRKRFQAWIGELWTQKDARIDALLDEARARA